MASDGPEKLGRTDAHQVLAGGVKIQCLRFPLTTKYEFFQTR